MTRIEHLAYSFVRSDLSTTADDLACQSVKDVAALYMSLAADQPYWQDLDSDEGRAALEDELTSIAENLKCIPA